MRKNVVLAACVAGIAVVAIVVVAMSGGVRAQQAAKAEIACQKPDRGQVHIPGGSFMMGSAEFYEEEGPVHKATVGDFWIDRYDVTNAEFARFVAVTHYVTDAERNP